MVILEKEDNRILVLMYALSRSNKAQICSELFTYKLSH